MPKLFPPALSPEVSRPLLAAAERIARVAPWEFMSDLELIGMRDETTSSLHVASILGTLGTMFAVVIYRNDTGLRWVHDLATNRTMPDLSTSLENMGLRKAKLRPEGIHVDNARLAAVLRPACEAIGVPLRQVSQEVAPYAWSEFEEYLSHQRPP